MCAMHGRRSLYSLSLDVGMYSLVYDNVGDAVIFLTHKLHWILQMPAVIQEPWHRCKVPMTWESS